MRNLIERMLYFILTLSIRVTEGRMSLFDEYSPFIGGRLSARRTMVLAWRSITWRFRVEVARKRLILIEACRVSRRWVYELFYPEIYVEIWSRDCDMVEGTRAKRFRNRREFNEYKIEAWEWAEGPITFSEISREEYESFEGYTRDRVMEAYENGRGNSIYV